MKTALALLIELQNLCEDAPEIVELIRKELTQLIDTFVAGEKFIACGCYDESRPEDVYDYLADKYFLSDFQDQELQTLLGI